MYDPLYLGVAGSAILLALFLANQLGRLTTDSRLYDLGNFAGAALLAGYSVALHAWPFLILNAVWALASARDLLRR